MKMRTLIALGALVSALGVMPAHATDDTCSIDGGSAASTHVDDPTDDSLFAGTGTNAVIGDPTDITGGWFSRGEDGTVRVNITLAQLTGTEADFVYYFRWHFAGNDDPAHADRLIRVQPRPNTPEGAPVRYGPTFAYGYFDNAAGAYTSVAATTGTVTTGTPGLISVVVPFSKMGAPISGDLLDGLLIESKFRVGSPGLPPGSPGLPASVPGYVFVAEDTSNGAGCDAVMF